MSPVLVERRALVCGALGGMCRLCLWARGQPSEGKVVCAQHSLRDSFVTLFVGSLSLLLGWEASCSENTCGEGGGVTRACGPQRREISRSRVCVRACLPFVCVSGLWGYVRKEAGR